MKEQLWKFTALHDYVCGDFMWTGIDYYGEAKKAWIAQNRQKLEPLLLQNLNHILNHHIKSSS